MFFFSSFSLKLPQINTKHVVEVITEREIKITQMIHTVNTVCGSVISLGAMSFAGCSVPAKPSLHNKHAQSSQLLSLLFIQHVLCPGRGVGLGWEGGSIDTPSPTAAPRAIMRGAQCCLWLILVSGIIISACCFLVVGGGGVRVRVSF